MARREAVLRPTTTVRRRRRSSEVPAPSPTGAPAEEEKPPAAVARPPRRAPVPDPGTLFGEKPRRSARRRTYEPATEAPAPTTERRRTRRRTVEAPEPASILAARPRRTRRSASPPPPAENRRRRRPQAPAAPAPPQAEASDGRKRKRRKRRDRKPEAPVQTIQVDPWDIPPLESLSAELRARQGELEEDLREGRRLASWNLHLEWKMAARELLGGAGIEQRNAAAIICHIADHFRPGVSSYFPWKATRSLLETRVEGAKNHIGHADAARTLHEAGLIRFNPSKTEEGGKRIPATFVFTPPALGLPLEEGVCPSSGTAVVRLPGDPNPVCVPSFLNWKHR